jgi:hypothetical protein
MATHIVGGTSTLTPASSRQRWAAGVVTAVAAAAFAYAFVVLLARYWVFYHLDNPGMGLGLLFGVLPLGFLVAFAVGTAVRRRLTRRGAPLGRATAAGAAGAALALGLLFALELWHSRAARSGEGDGAGDLAPFFASLVGRR